MTRYLTGAALIAAAFALPVSAFAQYEEPDTGRVLMLGAGAYAVTNPYESAKDDLELGALPTNSRLSASDFLAITGPRELFARQSSSSSARPA